MRYVPGSTTVETDAATAFAGRVGVCQDYAHVMIALAHMCGLAARYVSGHLAGEGGTHAWVEILAATPDGEVVAWGFDPTHDRAVGLDYLFIAAWRDYSDVAPTSGGRIRAGSAAERTVDRLDVEYAA